LSYAFTIYNAGNVQLRSVQLSVPALAGDSNDSSIACTYADSTSWLHSSDLAANSSLSCSGSFSFSQDAIEAGHISPDVSAAAANLAAPVTVALPAIAVPNTPSLTVAIDTTGCTKPVNAGRNRLLSMVPDATCSDRWCMTRDNCALQLMLSVVNPVTGGLWLSDTAHHHVAIAVLFLVAGHMYRTNWGIGHSMREILDAHKGPFTGEGHVGLYEILTTSWHAQVTSYKSYASEARPWPA
jgi:hypothetical protein